MQVNIIKMYTGELNLWSILTIYLVRCFIYCFETKSSQNIKLLINMFQEKLQAWWISIFRDSTLGQWWRIDWLWHEVNVTDFCTLLRIFVTGSPQLKTRCLAIVQSSKDLPGRIYNLVPKFLWCLFPTVKWLHVRYLATSLHLWPFAASCSQMTVFYNVFSVLEKTGIDR